MFDYQNWYAKGRFDGICDFPIDQYESVVEVRVFDFTNSQVCRLKAEKDGSRRTANKVLLVFLPVSVSRLRLHFNSEQASEVRCHKAI